VARVRRKPTNYQAQQAARSMVPVAPQRYTFDKGPQNAPQPVKDAQGYAWVDMQNNAIHAPHGLSRREKAHEVGHVFDHQVLNDADRANLQKIVGARTGNWYGGIAGPAEFFADYYAAAAMGDRPGHAVRVKGGGIQGARDVNINYTPINAKRLQRFKRALDAIGRRQNLGFGEMYARKNGPIVGANPIEQDG
jgi:hypothetical protein